MGCRVTSPMLTLGHVVEKFGFDRVLRHKDGAREGLHHVLARLQREGRLAAGRLRLPRAQCEGGAAGGEPK